MAKKLTERQAFEAAVKRAFPDWWDEKPYKDEWTKGAWWGWKASARRRRK